jgi:hypothetical protein
MLPLCLDDSDDSVPQSPKKHQLKIEVPTGKKARRKINNSTSTLIGNFRSNTIQIQLTDNKQVITKYPIQY